jgi:hypothetical protein
VTRYSPAFRLAWQRASLSPGVKVPLKVQKVSLDEVTH